MSGPSVLDTNVLLYLLDGEIVSPTLSGDHLISVISEIEVLSHPELTSDVERSIRRLLAKMRVIGLTPRIRDVTVDLRRKHRLKLPDAVICATAVAENLELVTNDSRLTRIPEVRTVAPKFKT